jgi:hypothetical protein
MDIYFSPDGIPESGQSNKMLPLLSPNACVQRWARMEAEETEPDCPARALEQRVRLSETRRQRRRKPGETDRKPSGQG